MAQIQCLSQILTGEILRHGTEKRADRAGNGRARPERSGAEAADVQRPVREHYTTAYCCDLKNAKSAVCGGKFTI